VFELTAPGGNWSEKILYRFSFSGSTYPTTIPGLALDDAGNLYGTLSNDTSAAQGLVFELSPSSGGSWVEETLYTFIGGNNGSVPTGSLLLHEGNLYSATLDGGNQGCGVVFELKPGSNGLWTERAIYAFRSCVTPIYPSLSAFDGNGDVFGFAQQGGTFFCATCGTVFELTPNGTSYTETDVWDFTDGSDGVYPTALVLGTSGQLYGTTDSPESYSQIQGTIFQLTPGNPWTLNTLYVFPISDGEEPITGLVSDRAGNFYGTTVFGGTNNVGAVFKITPSASGWNESLIYSFGPQHYDLYVGDGPSGLIFDAKGNLYDTTEEGGVNFQGSVFELSPQADGGWQEKDLYTFATSKRTFPVGGVVFDKAGNMYGVAMQGGAFALGGVFQLTPSTGGRWKANTIYSFRGYPADGATARVGLTIDSAGTLYGTTFVGGNGPCGNGNGSQLGCGTVFKLSYSAGKWNETVLHAFQGEKGGDGANPLANVILDGSGNLYGTTANGGSLCGCGTVFELSPSVNRWTESILFRFNGGAFEGEHPYGPLTLDQSGNLYGTCSEGGSYYAGTVFKLSPAGGGEWTERILHLFGSGNDGKSPLGSLILAPSGYLYGTTGGGGVIGGPSQGGQGIVFGVSLTP